MYAVPLRRCMCKWTVKLIRTSEIHELHTYLLFLYERTLGIIERFQIGTYLNIFTITAISAKLVVYFIDHSPYQYCKALLSFIAFHFNRLSQLLVPIEKSCLCARASCRGRWASWHHATKLNRGAQLAIVMFWCSLFEKAKATTVYQHFPGCMTNTQGCGLSLDR